MIRLFESAGIIVFGALLLSALQVIGQGAGWQGWAWAALALPVGYFCADFLTGVIHWMCDSFGNAQTPLWGPLLVAPFRRHHAAPGDITRISLAENLGASAIAGAAVLWLWSPQALRPDDTLQRFAALVGLWVIAFAVLSNLFHRWAHLPLAAKPRWMRRLQQWRVLLPAHDHALHHRKPHRVNYCILSGWANPLSNRVPWQRLEGWLARLGLPTNFD